MAGLVLRINFTEKCIPFSLFKCTIFQNHKFQSMQTDHFENVRKGIDVVAKWVVANNGQIH